VAEVSEHTGEITIPSTPGGPIPVFWRTAPVPGSGATPLYVHGVPTSSDDWVGFLARTGGIAPDLPGFGRSGKPGYLAYTMEEYDRFLERFLDERGLEKVSLVVHDWGGVGLLLAQRMPERIARVVIINAVPFLPGYRWHRTARIWRTLLLGEFSMGMTFKFTLRQLTRESNATPGPLPEEWIDSTWAHFDQGTQRAILRLYRSSPPAKLAAAGARLVELDVPALVIWGTRDPYIPEHFGRDYAAALPQGELAEYPDAGHWGWLDRPDMVDRVAAFLSEG
jgi:pimeloyl-ACP methyl ester carboxylesterase